MPAVSRQPLFTFRLLKGAAVVVLVGLLGSALYLVAAMRVKTPLSVRIVEMVHQETDGVHAQVKFTYELKNDSLFQIRVLEVRHLGASPSTIEYAFKSSATPFLLSPGAVHRETRTLSVNDRDQSLKNAFHVRWDPAIKPLIQPFLNVVKGASEWWHGTGPHHPTPTPFSFQPNTQEFPGEYTEIEENQKRS